MIYNSYVTVSVVVAANKFIFSELNSQTKHILDFNLYLPKLRVVNRVSFALTFDLKNEVVKEFQFRVKRPDEAVFWIAVTKANLNLTIQPQVPPADFWKFGSITHQALMASAQTGDLVLFSGKTFMDKVVRSVTSSKYDHVGILVKYPKSGQLVIFEALSGKGVCQWDWQTYQKKNYWRENFTQILLRRLVGVNRDAAF